LINQAKDVLLGCLNEVPFVTVPLMKEWKRHLTGADFQLRVKTQTGTTTQIFDVGSVQQPRERGSVFTPLGPRARIQW